MTNFSLHAPDGHPNPSFVKSAFAFAGLAAVLIAGCNEPGEFSEPGPRPQIVNVAGPKDSVVTCDPSATGGACPLAVTVTFRLPEDQFVWKAYVRFQGDGSDVGVDRPYLIDYTYGRGAGEVSVIVNAGLPPTILAKGQLFSYTVRLVTGTGEESTASKLSVSVQ